MSTFFGRVLRRGWRMGLVLAAVFVAGVASYVAGHRQGFHAGYAKAALEYGDEHPLGAYHAADLILPASAPTDETYKIGP